MTDTKKVTDCTIHRNNPKIAVLATVGAEIPTPHPDEYQKLWEGFGGEGEMPPAVVAFNGRPYVPTVYTDGSRWLLKWGLKAYPLSSEKGSPQLVNFLLADTNGFPGVHALVVWPGCSALFPVRLIERNTDREFLAALATGETGYAYVSRVDPSQGLQYIDDIEGTATELDVTVVDWVNLVGQERWGSKPYSIAVVETDDGERYKARCTPNVCTLFHGLPRKGVPIAARITQGKNALQVSALSLTMDHL